METMFELNQGSRANFLKHVMQSLSCSYICLWRSYFPDCLLFFDGAYDDENQIGTSSSGVSLARRLFDQYRLSMFPIVQNECHPGFAFKNSITYLELPEIDLQRLASLQVQKQFYHEARIKTAVFMGCKSGEIELGFANVTSHMNIKKELIMRGWLSPPEASSKSQLSPRTIEAIRENTDHQNQLSSSSSSLISLSTLDSPESSSLIFNTIQTSTSPSITSISHDHFFTNTNIYSGPSNTSSSSPHQNTMHAISHHGMLANPKPSCSSFKSYISSPLAPRTQARGASYGLGVPKQAMVKRSISFLRSLNLSRIRNQGMQAATRPTTSQLHHKISERKRREKLNENFHSLKSLLPPGTKKDKTSLLTTARDYIASLKAQVDELSKRNQQLEEAAKLKTNIKNDDDDEEEAAPSCSSSTERVSVTLTHVTTHEEPQKIVALQVVVRSGECSTEDVIMRILEFLTQVDNVSLISMEASTRGSELHSTINRVVLRLRVHHDQANEWDESAFHEAVRRVVTDVAHI